MNTKLAFKRIKQLTGQDQKHHHLPSLATLHFANSLNSFFNQYNSHDYTPICEEPLKTLPPQDLHHPTVSHCRRMCSRSWPGAKLPRHQGQMASQPKGGKILHWNTLSLKPYFGNPTEQLQYPFPGKPVRKTPRSLEPNYCRPVTLTPKTILHLILPTVSPQLDPYQFAYT